MTRRPWPGFALLFFALTLALGCQTPTPLYDWGIYEQLLWESYRAEYGDVDPADQLARLEEDVQRIVASGTRVPPGVHAHIGFLRYSTGDLAAAREHFVEERDLFPESAVFMDGVLARMARRGAPPAVPAGIPEPESSEADENPPDASDSEDSESEMEGVAAATDRQTDTAADAGESDQ